MGVSTDGQICFGALLEEDTELPWQDRDDIEDWWEEVKGYRPNPQLFDEHGEYLNGVEPPKEQVDAWLKHKREWKKENPLPVELVNVCSAECPIYILAVPGTGVSASRGYPKRIDHLDLHLVPDATALIDFCRKYGISIKEQIGWYLSSYWG